MEHSCEAGEEIWMCEKELGEEDKEKIGEVMVSSGSFCNSTEPAHMKIVTPLYAVLHVTDVTLNPLHPS